jgi:seryl-tRNA synthetase
MQEEFVMLDVALIRKDPEFVAKALAKREYKVDFTEFLAWDAKRRQLITGVEAMKAERNRIGKDIPQMKQRGESVDVLLAQMKETADRIKEMDQDLKQIDEQIDTFVAALPNLPAEDVAAGGKENNQPLHYHKEKPEFGFKVKDHVDLETSLGLIDYERGVKLGGNGFWLYTGKGAQFEWALLNYFVEEHLKDGYEFILPPHMLNWECGYTAGQFPKFEEDVFRLKEDNMSFMLPTAETALVNLYRDEILPESVLPKKLFAYTPCYRREAGSYRANERGMIRGHQFNKVEMFQFTTPEGSKAAHQELIVKAERLVQGLGLHYRLVKLAAGDCSASMATTYDIEVWLPSMNEYKEVSSVSNAYEYQARRGRMRYRRDSDKKVDFIHTLNGSGLATSRILPAILEQGQQADGSVVVPEPLRKWLGCDVLKPVK